MKKYKIENNQIIEEVILRKISESVNYPHSEGWRDEHKPEYDPDIETLGDEFYDTSIDKVNRVIVPLQLPSLEEVKAIKISELDIAANDLYQAITWYVVKKWASGEATPQAVKDKIIEIDTKKLQIETNINALTDPVSVIKYQLPYDQINALLEQLKAIS